uniref:Uncharacterized protein n=2 Tax=Nymphaea colorata TaxID=210225 RepID=A0A5K1HQF2_9MAGN|nr:unnamed protein product [Nymphaea colorata]
MYRHAFDKYAVNLQNYQIHVQYADSNKNCLKLYGHKMPINSFDISSDDALLVSGSTDKDIRFWDMDFGHSIKTVFAHSEPVTAVKFIHETHYVITGSKDGHVKFWDGDTHQLIMDLEENILEIRSIAITTAGDYIIAGGLDGGFRIWKQTNDQTIAGDQEEKNMDKVMIEEYATEKFKEREVKTRYEDLKHGEEIIEALENNEQPSFVLKLIKKVSPANLKSTLSFLHASHVNKLESYLRFSIKEKHEIELCWRIIEALDKSSDLGQELRKEWEAFSKVLRVNRESLKILLRSLRE